MRKFKVGDMVKEIVVPYIIAGVKNCNGREMFTGENDDRWFFLDDYELIRPKPKAVSVKARALDLLAGSYCAYFKLPKSKGNLSCRIIVDKKYLSEARKK